MNKNTIIGFVLIFILFIGFNYLMKPSEEQLRQQKRIADSVFLANQSRQDSDAAALARQRVQQAAKQKDKVVSAGGKSDSLSVLKGSLKDELGVFSNAALGKDTAFSIENDVFNIKIASRGGKIAYVGLKDYLTWDKRPLVLMDKDSLKFGLSFFSNNRIINTDRLYFQPFWPDAKNAGQAHLKVKIGRAHV